MAHYPFLIQLNNRLILISAWYILLLLAASCNRDKFEEAFPATVSIVDSIAIHNPGLPTLLNVSENENRWLFYAYVTQKILVCDSTGTIISLFDPFIEGPGQIGPTLFSAGFKGNDTLLFLSERGLTKYSILGQFISHQRNEHGLFNAGLAEHLSYFENNQSEYVIAKYYLWPLDYDNTDITRVLPLTLITLADNSSKGVLKIDQSSENIHGLYGAIFSVNAARNELALIIAPQRKLTLYTLDTFPQKIKAYNLESYLPSITNYNDRTELITFNGTVRRLYSQGDKIYIIFNPAIKEIKGLSSKAMTDYYYDHYEEKILVMDIHNNKTFMTRPLKELRLLYVLKNNDLLMSKVAYMKEDTVTFLYRGQFIY